MSRSVHPLRLVPGLGALALFALGCGSGGGARQDAPDVAFDRNALLAHLAHDVLLPMQASVEARTALLPASIAAHCDALDAGDPGATLAGARTAWQDAVDAWARAEQLLVGPATMDGFALRDRIYAWPAVAPCDLDRDVVAHWTSPASYDLSTRLGRQRSLSAIEYLLYSTGTSHSCPLEPAGWSALGADLPRARCRLALTLAVDVAAASAELHAAWLPSGGDYAGELARAGLGSSLPSAHEAVNLLSNSLFFVDRTVKDMKLGEAAGLVMNNACGTIGTPCLREVELPYSDRGTYAIRANLSALREGVSGATAAGDGPGFDDFLIAIGHADLAASMLADLDQAIARAADLPDSFLGALASDYAAVVDTHAAIRTFTNHLKSQFLTVLALDIPDDVASDND